MKNKSVRRGRPPERVEFREYLAMWFSSRVGVRRIIPSSRTDALKSDFESLRYRLEQVGISPSEPVAILAENLERLLGTADIGSITVPTAKGLNFKPDLYLERWALSGAAPIRKSGALNTREQLELYYLLPGLAVFSEVADRNTAWTSMARWLSTRLGITARNPRLWWLHNIGRLNRRGFLNLGKERRAGIKYSVYALLSWASGERSPSHFGPSCMMGTDTQPNLRKISRTRDVKKYLLAAQNRLPFLGPELSRWTGK